MLFVALYVLLLFLSVPSPFFIILIFAIYFFILSRFGFVLFVVVVVLYYICFCTFILYKIMFVVLFFFFKVVLIWNFERFGKTCFCIIWSNKTKSIYVISFIHTNDDILCFFLFLFSLLPSNFVMICVIIITIWHKKLQSIILNDIDLSQTTQTTHLS